MSAAPRDVRDVRDAPVRQRSLRTHNLGLVLRHVAANPHAVSRADVAAATGLTKATVSTLVDELLAGRLLVEVDPTPRTRAGRPAVGLRLAAQGPAGLGLEVNVDYLAACVVDLTGAVRHHAVRYHAVPPAADDPRALLDGAAPEGVGPAATVDALAELAAAAMAHAQAEGLTVAGTALAIPGLVADGVVHLAPNLGWVDVDIHAALRARVDLPGELEVENEANLATLAELHALTDLDPSRQRASFLYISGEIGVGAGVVLDGQLIRGARGFGGELGHLTIRPDGPRCRCGARGCLEAYANQDALLRSAGEESVARLVAVANAGALPALMALEQAGVALGVASADVVNLLDVDTIVLGGIYAPLAEWLIAPIQRELAERVLGARWAPVTVRACVLGERATVIGAAGSVVRAIRDAPATWLAASA